MADVSSKNMYALLGNDPEQDSDREPEPPTKAIDRTAARSGKRSGPEAAPAKASHPERGGRGGGRARYTGSEAAFQRGTDSNANRRTGIPDDAGNERRGRGGRGGRLRRADGGQGPRGHRDDRHSRGLPDHPKQGDAAWGAPTGEAEFKDEQAGEAIANQDARAENRDQGPDGPVDADGNALGADEEEEKQKSYAEYLAEQAAKKLNLGGGLEARKANEGSKDNKKWAGAKALNKDDEEDSYMAPTGGKTRREKVVRERNVVEIDHSWNESARGDRGGRGGRGRGDYRGDRGEYRGDRGDRGDRAERGEFRGRGGRGRGEGRGRGGEFRGGDRGDRGNRGGNRGGSGQVNVSDQSAFPSLGS